MKVIGNLPIVKDSSSNFPFGATIQNETDIQEGTPVVREIYGDVLMNLYRLLELAGITPTGTEDGDSSQYQIVEALKKLPNSLNDIERVLSLSTTVWSVDLKLSILPNKYFFFARASDNYNSALSYTFKGSDASPSYTFSSVGFSASDELLVIIDNSEVRAYSLNSLISDNSDLLLAMGDPLSFNDTDVLKYSENGVLYSDLPSVNSLQSVIISDSADASILVNDVFILQGYVLCFCYSVSNEEYLFYQFALTDLTSSNNVTESVFGSTDDFSPYLFTDGTNLYATNDSNNSEDDFTIVKLAYNPVAATISFVSSIDIDNSFVKTSNAVVKSNKLYTLVSGTLNSFNLTTGVKSGLGQYDSVAGRIFHFNNKIYFASGEVAKNWTI